MIYLDSRYVDGPIFYAWDTRKSQYQVTVARKWPSKWSKFFFYEWTAADRVDTVAMKFLNDPAGWWKIMDMNPELDDPLSIPPGTKIRIPND